MFHGTSTSAAAQASMYVGHNTSPGICASCAAADVDALRLISSEAFDLAYSCRWQIVASGFKVACSKAANPAGHTWFAPNSSDSWGYSHGKVKAAPHLKSS